MKNGYKALIPLGAIVAFLIFWEWLVWVNPMAELQNGVTIRYLASFLGVQKTVFCLWLGYFMAHHRRSITCSGCGYLDWNAYGVFKNPT